MINWFNSLNLKPQERRMVIGVLVVFFLLFNIWYVWPHFGDWAKNASKAEEAELKIKRYQTQVNNIARYRALIKELEQDGSTKIAAAEQALQFQKTIQEIANRSGVSINRYDPANPRRNVGVGSTLSQTNSFFEESGLSVQMQQVKEEDLVLFLYNIGNGNSNIRVKELELSPHSSGVRLNCKALLIASYQKTPTNTSTKPSPVALRLPSAPSNRTLGASPNENLVKTNKAVTNKATITPVGVKDTDK